MTKNTCNNPCNSRLSITTRWTRTRNKRRFTQSFFIPLWCYTLCLKKRPTFTTCYNFYIHSSIATIFGTNVVEKVGNKMYFTFPPNLTSASTLPGETGNPEIASFHLNAACCFTKKHNTVINITWSELNYPSLSKRSSGSTRQDLGREHSILLCVTHMLCVSQVCHGVSRCVKGGSCSLSSLE